MEKKYYCQVYRYDADGRNLILQAYAENTQAYAKQLNNLTTWDEVEFYTQPSTLAVLSTEDDSKFIGKIVNPKSQHIIIAKG